MTPPTATLTLHLLGPFALLCKGTRREFAYDKGRALLAFLAMQPGRPLMRAYLANLLWPDLERTSALANLRGVLHNLRSQLNSEADADNAILQISRESVSLQVDARLEVDVIRFAAQTPTCTMVPPPGFCGECLADMTQILALYQGEFLEGFALPDCPDFEDWLLNQRESLLQRALTRMTQLSDAHESDAAYADALSIAQRFLQLDPWNEHGARRVLRLMALCGRRDAALAEYEKWSRLVKDELGLLPSEETCALVDKVRHNGFSQTDRRGTDSVSPVPLAPRTQRRQVTVLHCALEVGLDEDPDVAMQQLFGPQQRCAEVIRAHSGYLVQAHGGSLLAYFGYPHASENAAKQAVRAALALRSERLAGAGLRIGVHSGMVISGGEPDVPDAIGSASGVAIRLGQLVEYGEIAISRASYRLVAGYFECRPLSAQLVAGKGSLNEAFRVTQESGARDRLEAAATLTPLIGRTREIATLYALWQQGKQNNPCAVLLQGDAGIGKSRIVMRLKEVIQNEAIAITELRCLPEYSQTPFYPLVTLLHAAVGFVPSDTPHQRAQKLAEYVQSNYPSEQKDVHSLLANLLSLPLAEPLVQAPTTSPQQRERTLQIVLNRLYGMAAPNPVLLVVEDLHWADPSSLELLNRIISHKRGGTWMAILTARPGFSPPWNEDQCTTLAVDTFNGVDARALINAVAPDMKPEVASSIVDRADGIPLFVEELARELSDNDLSAIPSTLQDLLTTRLDGMGAAKFVAQQAATIGRVFNVNLMRRISKLDEQALIHSLRQLHVAGLLQDISPEIFQFSHALVRDAAYQSQTRPEREAAHLRIAQALLSDGEVRPELLAQHWAAGGKVREAAQSWVAASQLARQHSAHQEAILHCKAGLALLADLPDDGERIRLEQDLQIKLGASLCATQGYTSAEGAAAYSRAVALRGENAISPDMFVAMWGLWASASLRVDYRHSLALAQQLQRAAEHSGDSVQCQQAHFAMGVTLFRQGQVRAAHTQFLQVRALYAPEHHASHVANFGEDAGVANECHMSGVLYVLGFPEQASHTIAQAVAYARQLAHPYSLAYALTYAMMLHCQLRQPAACLALAEETLALANRHGFALWQMGAALSHGWAMAQMKAPAGVEVMQQCVNATRSALGSVELIALLPLANAYVTLGCAEQALAVIEEALATGEAKADHHLDAELHRLWGEALLIQSASNGVQAEQCFEVALTIAREQEAKMFELRAATSLARHWKKKRKPHRAHTLLSGIYGSFSEGFDLPDLQEARQLLERLTPR